MSNFRGLEMAKQALFAQQSALYTTGHNISNANTKGYSRQRVNFSTSTPYPAGSRNRPQIPGQLGTGVQIETVERIRNRFLDEQFRVETSKAGYWETLADSLSRLENLLNEPSDSGLAKTFDQFWQSLQDLSVSPENSGARSVVAHRGLAVAETMQYLSNTLKAYQEDIRREIHVTISDANSLIRQIHQLNEQILRLEPHGMLPNDLYDDRDRLIDELSNLMNIQVTYHRSSDSAPDIANGLVTITLVDEAGKEIGNPPIKLIDGEAEDPSERYHEILVNQNVTNMEIAGHDGLAIFNQMGQNGSIHALLHTYGYEANGVVVEGEYPSMLATLNELATAFVMAFNEQHAAGIDLDGEQGIDFFVFDDADPASSITVNEEILEDPNKIAAGAVGAGSRNGDNATQLSLLFDQPLERLHGESVRDYFASAIGRLGVRAQEANRMSYNADTLRSQVDEQRLSVSGVSLDEEMANMIKFQHAYNAAARNMTVIDEMLDRIINGMGLVGR